MDRCARVYLRFDAMGLSAVKNDIDLGYDQWLVQPLWSIRQRPEAPGKKGSVGIPSVRFRGSKRVSLVPHTTAQLRSCSGIVRIGLRRPQRNFRWSV